jgi:hypothetical protein
MRRLLSDDCPNPATKREAHCVDTHWVMLTEDDFIPCPVRFSREMPGLLLSDCVHRKDIMAIRVSSGGSGILIPCGNLGRIADLFERMLDRGPADSLLSFILSYQPEFKHPQGDDRGMELHRQRVPYLVYKHSLLEHIGVKRTKGGEYVKTNPKHWWSYVPDCNSTSLDSAGLLGEEYFDRECQYRSIVSPCGLRAFDSLGPGYYHTQRNKANWHPWSGTLPAPAPAPAPVS